VFEKEMLVGDIDRACREICMQHMDRIFLQNAKCQSFPMVENRSKMGYCQVAKPKLTTPENF